MRKKAILPVSHQAFLIYRRIGLCLLLLVLQWTLFKPSGLWQTYQVYQDQLMAKSNRDFYAERNATLQLKRDWLYRGEGAVAHYARKTLGLVKQGEVLYLFAEQDGLFPDSPLY